jgi:glycosyltransferase involved in cell wall biosynthesis
MISCILMPQGRRWAALAILWFGRQQYEPAELLVLDRTAAGLGDIVPADRRIRYLRMEDCRDAATALNFACSQARGEIVAQWQEGVWYASDFLLCLAEGLSRNKAGLGIIDPLHTYDIATGRGWKVSDPAGGNGMLFRRACWVERPFDGPGEGMIERFVSGFSREQAALIPDRMCRVGLVYRPGESRPYPAARLRALLGHDGEMFGLKPLAWCQPRRPPRLTDGPSNVAHPLVSAILLSNNLRMAAVALDGFLSQDYEPRELIVVDDAAGTMEEMAGGDARIRCVRPGEGVSEGAKRNLACSAARGKIVLQWDEDAWRSPSFIRYVVEQMLLRRADICCLSPSLWYDPASAEAWMYHHPLDHGFRAAGAAAFRRNVWDAAPFPDTDEGASLRFVWRAGGRRVIHVPPEDRHVFIRDKPERTGGPYWQPFSADRVRPILGRDAAAYEAELPRVPSIPPAPLPQVAAYAGAPFSELLAEPPPGLAAMSERMTVRSQEQSPEHRIRATPQALGDSSSLLVSCIMPTFNRRPFVPLALASFFRQTYAPRELIVIDDGSDPVQDLMPPDRRIRYVRVNERMSVGAKRNLACEQARGAVIAHWDDDDWHSPSRLQQQLGVLLREPADLCGMNPAVFFDLRTGMGWIYEYPQQQFWAHGSTFCYRRSFWERHRFAEIDVGEDNQFIWKAPPDSRMIALRERNWHVSMMHDRNVSPKSPGGAYWRPLEPGEIRRAMGADWHSFQKFLPVERREPPGLIECDSNDNPDSDARRRAFFRSPSPCELAQFLIEAFPDARSILEAGCADGGLIGCLREAGRECWGFDQVSGAIERASPAVQPYVKLAGIDCYRFERPFDLLLAFGLLVTVTESQAFTFLSRARHWIRGAVLAATPSAPDRPGTDKRIVETRQRWQDLFVRAGWRQDFLHRSVERSLQRHPLPVRLGWDLYVYAP